MAKYFKNIWTLAKKKDFLPKLVCIFLAVILWAYIAKTQKSDVRFRVPIAVKGLSKGNVISKIADKYLTVHFFGTSEELKNTNLRNIKIFVDLSKPALGKYKAYTIGYTREQIPEGVEVDLSTKKVKVLVEKKIRKKVRVIPVYDDNQGEGFVVGKVLVKPNFVTISGAQSQVAPVDSINTEELELKEATQTVSRVTNLDRAFKYGDSLDIYPSTVTLVVPIISKSMVRNETLDICLTNGADKFSYEILTRQVEIEYILGKENSEVSDYRAIVNLKGIDVGKVDKGGVVKNCKVTLLSEQDPFLKQVLSLKPDFVEVRISIKE